MKKEGVFTALILLMAAAAAGAQPVDRSRFRYMAALEGTPGTERPAAVTLGEEVISRTAPGFADLRLFDDTGQETPYVIYPEAQPGERKETFRFEPVSLSNTGQSTVIVLRRPEGAGLFTGIEISTPARDFRKHIYVASNRDGRLNQDAWTEVASGMIFDFSSQLDLRKTTIEFPPVDEDHIRVVLDPVQPAEGTGRQLKLKYDGIDLEISQKPDAPFRVDGVTGWSGENRATTTVYDAKEIPDPPRILDGNRDSVYDLGKLNLVLARLTLEAGRSYYHRRLEIWEAGEPGEDNYRPVASGTIYNLPGMERPVSTVSVPTRRYAYVRVKVINGDNPPIGVQGLELQWPRQNLYFIPEEGRTYFLYAGGQEVQAPRYEMADIITNDPAKLGHYGRLGVGPVRENAAYDPRITGEVKNRMEKAVLIVVVLILVAVLSWWLYSLMRKMGKGAV